jgi:hypothetical protein
MISLNKKIASIFLMTLLSGIFIAGCSPPTSITNETAHAVSLSPSSTMATSLIPAETETPAVTNTLSATFTPVAPTFTISPTCTQSLPTPTRLPTVQAEEAEIRILELLRNNGGCDFPCWWGIIPGETNLQTARSFLETYESISISNIFDADSGYARWFVNEDDLIIDIRVSLVSDREPVAIVEGMHFVVQVTRRLDEGGFEVVWENPLNERYLQAYRLPKILNTYGLPDDVLVQANEYYGEFYLLLDYSTQGFTIWYMADMEQNGDIYRGCMANAYEYIYLWDPDLAYTWAEGITRTSSGEAWEIDALREVFQPLEEATSLTLGEFYQIFSNPENTSCLETLVEIWPGP